VGPVRVLSEHWGDEKHAENPEQAHRVPQTIRMHDENYIAVVLCVEARSERRVFKKTPSDPERLENLTLRRGKSPPVYSASRDGRG